MNKENLPQIEAIETKRYGDRHIDKQTERQKYDIVSQTQING